MTGPGIDYARAMPRRTLALPGGRKLVLAAGRPLVMGIVNATPDSFSDGRPEAGAADHAARALGLRAEGAAILDVGGESTRPGARELPPDEERARVVPVIAAIRAADPEVAISIDTRKAAVAAAALDAGADLVNDVSGLAFDPAMAGLVAARRVPLVLMHMRGTPLTMKGLARYPRGVVATVRAELAAALAAARRAGIPRGRILLDPGIGFAKDWRQSLELLRRLDALAALGCPLLVGASRKSLLGPAAGTGPDPAGRLPGSLVLAVEAARRGAAVLRVHDVGATVQALRTWKAVEAGARAEDLSPRA